MKEVTKGMIKEFKIYTLGYDFMGYRLMRGDIYNFHHLIIPNRCGGPIERWNGAILCGKSSHPYLHLIEAHDIKRFGYITSEMIDMNIKGYLDIVNLKRIDDVLREFESIHSKDHGKKGRRLIRDVYLDRVKF